MAWTKTPPAHHGIFRAALPADPRIQTLAMFGGLAAKVNGNFFGGAFGRSVMLYLSDDHRTEALALEGAGPFDPMGNGSKISDKVQMPESIMDDDAELRLWVRRAYEHAAALPRKAVKKKAAKKAAPKKKPTAKKKAPAKKKR